MSWRHALRSSDQNLCIGIQSSRVRVPTCALPLYLLTTDSSPIRSIHPLFLGKRIQYGSTLYTRSKHSLWSQIFSKYRIKCTYSISTLKDVFVTFFALFVDLTEFLCVHFCCWFLDIFSFPWIWIRIMYCITFAVPRRCVFHLHIYFNHFLPVFCIKKVQFFGQTNNRVLSCYSVTWSNGN